MALGAFLLFLALVGGATFVAALWLALALMWNVSDTADPEDWP